jgi:catechol 2,3-dioxygenase
MNKTSKGPRTGYFRPRRLGHVNLYISEYERSLRFYREIAGLGDGWTRPAIGGAFLNNGASHHDIGFIPWNSPATRKRATGPGLNHLGFELESEVDLVDSYQDALTAGVKFQATVDHLVARSVYSWDPDGHGIELYADTEVSYKQPDFLELRRASGDWAPGKTTPSGERRYVIDHQPRMYENALFHARKVTGAVIVTAALEAAYDYYTGLVGLAPIAGGRDHRFASLGGVCGGRDVTLFRAGTGHAPGFHHMHFVVFDEADLARSTARAAQFGVVVERQIDHPLRRGVVVRDPDGICVLLYLDRQPAPAAALNAVNEEHALWLV